MSKRRKSGWRVLNRNAPHRKWQGRIPRKPRTYKQIFRALHDNVFGANSGKSLDSMCARGERWWRERDRERDQSYFLVRLRGNHLVVTRYRYIVDGTGSNIFLGSLLGFGPGKTPTVQREVILRHPVRQWRTFVFAYAQAAPTLKIWLERFEDLETAYD